jgi:mannose-6-phosphate isomerase-like protein (cupin superfamily)
LKGNALDFDSALRRSARLLMTPENTTYYTDSMQKVNVAEKFALFSDHWKPQIIGELNDSFVKAVKFKGDFLWHHHDNEDELFFVVRGTMRMWLKEDGPDSKSEREIVVRPGEFIIIPKGVEHMPKADPIHNDGECHVLLLEPKTTLNTGNVQNERTRPVLDRL